MNAEIQSLVNELMVSGRKYVKAIEARDALLAKTFQSESSEDIAQWQEAAKAVESAHEAYYAVLDNLHAVREKRA